jgi:hypothetical protein
MPLLRVFGSVSPLERLRLSLGVTALHQKYQAEEIAFGGLRADDTLSVDLAANVTVDTRWSLRADFAWSDNRSNHDLYDSRRGSGSLKLRYQY